MVVSLQTQIEEVRRSMEGLEARRAALGEAVVNPALAALRKQLAALEEQAAAQAARINLPEWRQSWLENIPEHRALMEMWDRSAFRGQQSAIS